VNVRHFFLVVDDSVLKGYIINNPRTDHKPFKVMPFDGHSYLVSQGWSGNGSGLRQGAISKPVIIHQKKNLAGLGKDRDEDFPFWDQYVAAFFLNGNL
jgi:hypothetical protein